MLRDPCPFHGFAWTIDGDLQDIPSRWDFPQVEAEDFKLPQAKTGVWAGFVFINPDPDAEPLMDFIGEMDDHFQVWDLERRFKQAHVAKVIHANWKIAQEAFCEAYHVNATHPQIMPYLGDTNSQIDIWDNFSRVITAGGTPSPNLDWTPTEDEMMRAMMDEKIDIGIATVPDSFQAYQREPLFNDNFGLICAPDHPLSQSSEPLAWQELRDQPLITNDLCRTIASAEFRRVCEQATMNAHNTLSLIALVKAGLGATVLPRMVVNLHPGDVLFRPLTDKTAVRQIDLLYRAGNTASPVTQVFCDYITRNCRSQV